MEIKPLFVYPHRSIWYNDTSYQNWYEEGYEIELLQTIRNTNKKSLAIECRAVREYCKYNTSIFVLGVV
jgi:hypothetical protein